MAVAFGVMVLRQHRRQGGVALYIIISEKNRKSGEIKHFVERRPCKLEVSLRYGHTVPWQDRRLTSVEGAELAHKHAYNTQRQQQRLKSCCCSL